MLPSFTNAEYIIAICIGFTKTSPWPYPEFASCVSFVKLSLFEYEELLIVCGNSICCPNPIFFSEFIKFLPPIFKAALAKYMLSECINAFLRFAGPLYVESVVI